MEVLMPKKRIIIVTAYMLACCIILGAYSFVITKYKELLLKGFEETKSKYRGN